MLPSREHQVSLVESLAAKLHARPTDDAIRLNLATALFYSGDFESAEPLFRELHARHPEEPAILINYPGLLGELGQHAEGRRLARGAARLFAQDQAFAVSHSSNLLKVGLFEEAEAFCTRLQTRFPGALLYNRGVARLFQGKFAAAWRDMEHRPTGPHRSPPPAGLEPWGGQRIDRPLVVEMEQGLGDSLQFLRYLPELSRGATDLTVLTAAPLLRLVRETVPTAQVLDRMAPRYPPQGYFLRSMSLPHLLARPTPDPAPYLRACPQSTAAWARRLGIKPGEKALAVAWSTQSGSFNARIKSLPIDAVRPLRQAGFRLIAAQKVFSEEVCAARAEGVETLPEDADFADLGAILPLVTGVASIDTACAHLAGAMGAPLYLWRGPQWDWRWSGAKLGAQTRAWYRPAKILQAPTLAAYRAGFTEIATLLPGY